MGPPSPFTKNLEVWIVEQYGKLGRIRDVRRSYRLDYKLNLKDVLKDTAFIRVLHRFKDTGSVVPAKQKGRSTVFQVSRTAQQSKHFDL